MSRQTKQRKFDNSIAVIADGKTEKWYLEKVKIHYPCEVLKTIRIELQLPQKKQIEELVQIAKEKAEEGYKRVVIIIDLDAVLIDNVEFEKFKAFMDRYDKALEENPWMKKLEVIVNNPCLEYWHLLHFNRIGKLYRGYGDMEKDLLKVLPDYDKSEKYYCGNPDIYVRLGGEAGLSKARNNAKPLLPFSIQTCKEKGISEMGKLFDYFDSL